MNNETGSTLAQFVNEWLQKAGVENVGSLQVELFGNTVTAWIIAAVLFVAINVFLHIWRVLLLNRFRAFSKKTKWRLDDVLMNYLNSLSWFFYTAVSLFFAVQHLYLPEVVYLVVKFVFLLALALEVIKVTERVVQKLVSIQLKKTGRESGSLSKAISVIIRLVLWIVAILMILSNMGLNVTSLIASLGIGGLAVSLALQPVFQDIFSSFSIILDKPFEEGDFIIYGDFIGTVKKIGLKTTRLQALQGEEVVLPNIELTSGKIQNFKKLQQRRVVFGFGVTYDTPSTKLKKIPKMVEKIAKEDDLVEFDRAHFKEFGDSSLVYEVVYYIASSDYMDYMNSQEQMNLKILQAFEKEGIEMAFPTRTVHLYNAAEEE